MSSHAFRAHLSPVLLTACGFALAASGLAASAREPAPPPVVRGSSDPAPAHRFESDIAAFEKWDRQNASPKDPVLFVGSSSVRLWQTAKAFPDLPVINRGFGGSTIADVNHFFDRVVLKYTPRVIVFYSGDNDITAGMSPRQVFDDFQSFVNRVHDQLPETQILVLSIKPSIARKKLWPIMKEANMLLEKLAKDDEQLDYVDLAAPMLAGAGTPPSSLFLNDGLHLNAKGYKLWNKTLTPSLESALKHH